MPWGANPDLFRHANGPSHPIEETLDVLDDLVKDGKIRHVGLSNESAWGTMTFLQRLPSRGLPRVQSVQNAYNLRQPDLRDRPCRSLGARGCEPSRLFAPRPGLF